MFTSIILGITILPEGNLINPGSILTRGFIGCKSKKRSLMNRLVYNKFSGTPGRLTLDGYDYKPA
jgi:hypothetical protein